MNILFILPEYLPHSGGGISTYYQHYIAAIRPYCNRIKVVVGSGYTQAEMVFNRDGVEVEYLSPSIFKEYSAKFSRFSLIPEFKKNIAAAWAMWHQARQGEGFDLVECTDFGLGFIPWAVEHRLPLVTRLHGSTGQISLFEENLNGPLLADICRQAELLLLPLSDKLITHSKNNQAFWQKALPAVHVEHINPIYQSAYSEPLPFHDRARAAVVAARIQKWKGPAQLCEAARLARSPLEADWFGRDMPYNDQQSTDQYLRSVYQGIWGVSISPKKPVLNQEMAALQRAAKFGIVPSPWDMFNFSCVEFLAAGTPVICSLGAGAGELVEHGVNGFSYEPGDVAALASHIDRINGMDEKCYTAMAHSALNSVRVLLAPEILAPAYYNAYRAAVSAFRKPTDNSYMKAIYGPSEQYRGIEEALDQQPLKLLAAYVFGRFRKKLSNRG